MKYILLILRVMVASVFIVSGTEKLLQPSQNFLYVIQGYQIFPWLIVERMVAVVFPWIELFLGVLLMLGLWLRVTLSGLWLCTLTFILLVGQAQIRLLPISSCGCFGDLVKLPLPVVMTFDSDMLLIITLLFSSLAKTSFLSLDRYFQSSGKN
jgi:uncharacterized membrane protein YphA (DoxX/SURF4 family)